MQHQESPYSFVEFDDIYDIGEITHCNLAGFPRENLIVLASFFLNIPFEPNNHKHLKKVVPPKFLTFIDEKIKSVNKQNPILFNPRSSFEFYQMCQNNADETELKKPFDIAIKHIIQQYLILNYKLNLQQQAARNVPNQLPDSIKVAAFMFVENFSKAEILIYNPIIFFNAQIIKAFCFYKWIKDNSKYDFHIIEIIRKFEVKTFSEFIRHLFDITAYTADSFGKVPLAIIANFENSNFLKSLTLPNDSKIEEADFKQVRLQPFHQLIGPNVCQAIFPFFVLDLLFKGIYFHFLEVNKSLKTELDFTKSFNHDFCEGILLDKILKQIFRDSKIACNKINTENKNDYIIQDGANIYCITAINFFTPNFILYFNSWDLLFNEVISRFIINSNDCVQSPFERLFKCLKEIKAVSNQANCKKIYPIIIVFDTVFNVPGLNKILDYYFTLEFDKYKIETVSLSPLCIIDIDSLLYFQDSINNRIELSEMIDKYFPAGNSANSPSYGFGIFLAEYMKERNWHQTPQEIAEIKAELQKEPPIDIPNKFL